MGQDISISADINVVEKVIHFDEKKRKKIPLTLNCVPSEEIKRIKTSGGKVPSRGAKKICVVFCNSYDHTSYALGDSALNDGILTYHEMTNREYDVYLYHDVMKETFRNVLINALQSKADRLVVYYIGHGTRVRDMGSDEADRFDECVVCMDGTIVDDELSKLVLRHNTCKKLVLISDCCHSGTIYDVMSRDDIVTIGACQDGQTAKQDWIDHKGNGIFTYYFWKYMAVCNSAAELQAKMNPKLRPYDQKCAFSYPVTEIL